MGAVVASQAALGYSPKVLHEIAVGIPMTKLRKVEQKPFKHGLHGGLLQQGIKDYLQPFGHENNW